MAVPSPLGDVKIVSPISTFVLNTFTLNKKFFFFFSRVRIVRVSIIAGCPQGEIARTKIHQNFLASKFDIKQHSDDT